MLPFTFSHEFGCNSLLSFLFSPLKSTCKYLKGRAVQIQVQQRGCSLKTIKLPKIRNNFKEHHCFFGELPKPCEWYIKDKMSNKILQCCSKQFKEKASMSNYLPRVLDCRETPTFGQPQLHTGTNCGGLAVPCWAGSFAFSCFPVVTLGPLSAPQSPGVVPALRAVCPAGQVKADLSHFYFSICSCSHHFLPEAPFCFWSALEHACPDFCCLKDKRSISLLQTKLYISIFYHHFQSVLFAWGISLLTVPPLHQTENALPERLFSHLYLPVLFYTATCHQAWTEKQSWMSPKQTLIWGFNCKFTLDGRLPVSPLA